MASVFRVEELSMSHAHLARQSRDPLAPQFTGEWLYKGSLNLRFNAWGFVFSDNRIHTEGTGAAVKTVGWWWMNGIRLTPDIDIFHEHHSRHIMDEQSPSEGLYGRDASRNFPVEDSYGIRINLITGKRGKALWR